MRLKFCSPNGYGSMVIDDDASDEEIVQKMMIAATTKPDNGSARSIRNSLNKETQNGSEMEQ